LRPAGARDDTRRRASLGSRRPFAAAVGAADAGALARPGARELMRIWIDLTAPAHPVVLRPIIERLRAAGHDVEVTARDYAQTIALARRLGLQATEVGRHGGASRIGKLRSLTQRTVALLRWARPRRFDVA